MPLQTVQTPSVSAVCAPASASDPLRRLREEQFPALRDRAYLDCAAIGIAPQRAVAAVCDLARRTGRCADESGTDRHVALKREHTRTRALAARLIGAGESDVALVESTTHGLSIATAALPLGDGDAAAVSELEYIQLPTAWSHLKRRGVKIRRMSRRGAAVSLDAVREQLAGGARAVSISSVQWTSGARADLAALGALCREYDAFLVVDAAQHLGALPLNVEQTPVDVLVCGGHKWLNAPFGLGLLYLSPRIRERLRPPAAGFFAAPPPGAAASWGEAFTSPGFSAFEQLSFTGDARAWEPGGTPNFLGAAGLGASLKLIEEAGIGRIAARISALTDRLIDGLERFGVCVVSPRDPAARSGIVAFTVAAGSADIAAARHLLAAGVAVGVRYTAGVGGVRVSCHWFNTEDDVDRLLTALREFLKGGQPPRSAEAESRVRSDTPRPHAADGQRAETVNGAVL